MSPSDYGVWMGRKKLLKLDIISIVKLEVDGLRKRKELTESWVPLLPRITRLKGFGVYTSDYCYIPFVEHVKDRVISRQQLIPTKRHIV